MKVLGLGLRVEGPRFRGAGLRVRLGLSLDILLDLVRVMHEG